MTNNIYDKVPDEDPSVPTDLLDLYVELEDNGVTPEEFKEAFGNESHHES